MTARISLILREARAHRARLQLLFRSEDQSRHRNLVALPQAVFMGFVVPVVRAEKRARTTGYCPFTPPAWQKRPNSIARSQTAPTARSSRRKQNVTTYDKESNS